MFDRGYKIAVIVTTDLNCFRGLSVGDARMHPYRLTVATVDCRHGKGLTFGVIVVSRCAWFLMFCAWSRQFRAKASRILKNI